MKVFMIILSLMFVSCVTANTRDLSAINPKTESARQTTLKVADDDACTTSCEEDGHSPSDCSDACSDHTWQRRRSSSVENKKPLKVANTYDACVLACGADGYDEYSCMNACK